MLRQEREHSPTGSVSRSRLPAYCAMKSTIASRMNNADALKDAIKWARDTPIELILKSGVFADAGRKFLVVLLARFRLIPMESSGQKLKILFICTWNASRSIFAEYFMRELGSDRFDPYSAGVKPKGEVSPITLKVLKEKFRIDASDARSKSWEDFKTQHLDFIVSVSEQAEETSHAFPDKPILAHWPYADPTLVHGTPQQVESAYFQIASRIRYRLQLFNNLSFEKLDRLRIELKMKELSPR